MYCMFSIVSESFKQMWTHPHCGYYRNAPQNRLVQNLTFSRVKIIDGYQNHTNGQRSDKRGLMGKKEIKIKIFIACERPSFSEYFLKI